MKNKTIRFVFSFLVILTFLIFSNTSFATKIHLTNGDIVEGEIVEKTSDAVKVDVDGMTLTYWSEDIESIEGEKMPSEEEVKPVAKDDVNINVDTTDGLALMKAVKAKYRSLDAFSAVIKTEVNMQMMQKDQSANLKTIIKLGRDKLYNIVWHQDIPFGNPPESAIWSTGADSFLLVTNAYTKIDAMTSFGAAAGNSMSTAVIVPGLFFEFLQDMHIIEDFENFEVQGNSNVGGEECILVNGVDLSGRPHTFCISSSRYIILSHEYSLAPSMESIQKNMTDAELIEALEQMGQEPTPEAIANMRAMVEMSASMMEKMDFSGTAKSVYEDIVVNSVLEPSAYEYQVPEGVEFVEDMFGKVFGEESQIDFEDLKQKMNSIGDMLGQ